MELKDKLVEEFLKEETRLKGEKNSYGYKARKQSLLSLQASGFPGVKHEEWKYTDTNLLSDKNFSAFLSVSTLPREQLEKHCIPGLEGLHFVFVNGVFNKGLSSYQENNSEFTIKENSDSIQATGFEQKEYRKYNSDGFIYLNEAFSNHHFSIEILANVILQTPIVFSFFVDATLQNILSVPRISFKSGINTEVKIVEQHIKLGSHTSLIDSIIELVIEENSNVRYYKIQEDEEETYHIGTTQVNQVGKSVFNAITVTLGGKLIRNNLNVTLKKPFSETHLFGLALLNKDNHVDNHTVVDHTVPDCESNEIYKNILDDNTSGVFNGKIFVRKDAQKTNAYQSSKNILLSENATAYSKPQLEIWADDVKCSHGHATGQLDKEALFYLRSRGIGEKAAKQMLVKAFAEDILTKITIPAIKSHLENLIESRFNTIVTV